MATTTAVLVRTNGARFPGETEVVWRLRAGRKGSGRILHEVRGRGDVGRQQAADQCMLYAADHDIEIVGRIEDGEFWPTGR